MELLIATIIGAHSYNEPDTLPAYWPSLIIFTYVRLSTDPVRALFLESPDKSRIFSRFLITIQRY